ncbi:hypothetical protein DMC30DRAFT_417118 [Rhodotorula diobovata]|uniref:Uncharacterized protein n=1 Tax=Rhodotorula diobovata TaxID=5288 RepID=A0A5C5FTP5_9BASI|nr:hypothetical protein DMC30DRAFT_417118 [Rhodotorula diobovata]
MAEPKEKLEKMAKDAFETRLEGNELFKAGELQQALRKYHQVLLVLKGINWQSEPQKVVDSSEPLTEVDEDEAKEIEAAEGKGKEKEKTPAAAGDEDMGQQIKTALLNTYLNSAAIYIKQERWQRALESAKSAQKFDETNPKAKFREGQALIGLGQITAGKRLLEELQQVNPDSAVAAALNKLAQDEVQRSIKAKNELKGFLNRKPDAASSSSGSKEVGKTTASTTKDEGGATAAASSSSEPVKAGEADKSAVAASAAASMEASIDRSTAAETAGGEGQKK